MAKIRGRQIMKKAILIFLILFIALSCKKNESGKSLVQTPKNSSGHFDKKGIGLKQNLTCDDLVYELVKTTQIIKSYSDFHTRIESIENNSIKIQVYVENNLSDNPKNKEIVESTLAWLVLYLNEKKLLNITSDPENPINEKFDNSILNKTDIFKSCGISNHETKQESLKICSLPFDFNEYYNNCVLESNDSFCNKNFPVYNYDEENFKSIIINCNALGIPSQYFYLPKKGNFQPIILAYNDSDVEHYELVVVNNKLITASLEIALMDGLSIKDFIIAKDCTITIYKRKTNDDKRGKIKSYKINDMGSIIEIKQ